MSRYNPLGLLIKKPKGYKKIWRYMDFPKFVFMIANHSLFFSRASDLADKFEGTFPALNQYMEYIDELAPNSSSVQKYATVKQNRDRAAISKQIRSWVMINSWHESDFESVAMWKLYCQSNEGIAIQSTYFKLIQCLKSNSNIIISEVRYIDFSSGLVVPDLVLRRFLINQSGFQYELELR